MTSSLRNGFAVEERRLRRVSKDEARIVGSWFETREAALLTMRNRES
jgi:hypothetical protein